jgi:hypothetical protein
MLAYASRLTEGHALVALEETMKYARLAGVIGAAATITAGVAGYRFVFRPWQARWGATDEEVRQSMPGDEELSNPQSVTTRAVTINARPEGIWPWLIQIGTGRAGWYSYDWIERAMGLQVESAREIIPEYQHLAVGDTIPLAPGYEVPVKAIEPNQLLLLSDYTPSIGGSVWAITLYPLDEWRTRLVWRLRARFNWSLGSIFGGFLSGRRDDLHHGRIDWLRELPMYLFIEPGSFLMTRKCMLGIKSRAEAYAQRQRERPGTAPATASPG